MLRLKTRTALSPAEVRLRAVDFFGPNGYGLEVQDRSADLLLFNGAGDTIELITETGDHAGAVVDLVTREWAYQAQRFAEEMLEP